MRLRNLQSKYPPAEPEALRLLAPQKGPNRNRGKTESCLSNISAGLHGPGNALPCHSAAACFKPCILPELSNFYGLPGKVGGTPAWISRIGSLVSSVLPVNREQRNYRFQKRTSHTNPVGYIGLDSAEEQDSSAINSSMRGCLGSVLNLTR